MFQQPIQHKWKTKNNKNAPRSLLKKVLFNLYLYMQVCVYICECVCVHVSVYVTVCACEYVCICVYMLSVYVRVYMWVCVHMCVHVSVCVHMCTCECVHVHVCTCECKFCKSREITHLRNWVKGNQELSGPCVRSTARPSSRAVGGLTCWASPGHSASFITV